MMMYKKNKLRHHLLTLVLGILGICATTETIYSLPLDLIKLPPGFHINLYASVPGARELAFGDHGILYVSTRQQGKIYAVFPNGGYDKASAVKVIAKNLNMPNGVAYRKGDLYVAEINRVLVFRDIEHHFSRPDYVVINDHLPTIVTHGWRYLRFSPDDYLYFGIGAPCNVCLIQDPRFATIMRMKPDGSAMEIYAKGVRNTVGFDWNPIDHHLWFTDNGRDWLGDNLPPDKLNFAPNKGMNFGFPYFYGNNQPDPEYGHLRSSQAMVSPAMALGPHVASLGMTFYTGTMFPEKYRNQIIIAEHGSWNRSHKIGYRLTWVRLQGNKALSYEPFATGWLQGENNWGRPVDVRVAKDGSLFVSDDGAGVVYRITYKDQHAGDP